MSEMMIGKDICIDCVESMRADLEGFARRRIQDAEVVKKFILSEKNTRFYMDKKLNSYLQPEKSALYLWLDTGFCDENGRPVFVFLINACGEYIGHQVGTARMLAERIKMYHSCNRRQIEENYQRFLQKYELKISERKNKHIENIKDYFLAKANEEEICENEFAKKLHMLNVVWMVEPEPVAEPEKVEEPKESFNEFEEEITVAILLDKLEKCERYNQELLEIIETSKMKNAEEIRQLQEKNKEISEAYKQISDAFVNARMFTENQSIQMNSCEKEQDLGGHHLLNKKKKILVLGACQLGTNVMNAIIKNEYGFAKDDFVYETDYEKLVHATGRIQNSNRYQAVIFGACPHNVKGLGGWSSIIERYKQDPDMPFAVDARRLTGEVKVTKESFRRALDAVCEYLQEEQVMEIAS